MGIEELLPKANFPSESGMYKIAQMIIDGKRFLRFSEYKNDDITHYFENWTPALIEKTAKILGRIFPVMEFDHGKFGKFMIPTEKSEWYELVGAGYADVDVDNKRIKRFLGKSCVYPSIDKYFNQKISEEITDWKLPVD